MVSPNWQRFYPYKYKETNRKGVSTLSSHTPCVRFIYKPWLPHTVPVRRASALPAASFGFHLTMDTLDISVTAPPVAPVKDFHFQAVAPCQAHK